MSETIFNPDNKKIFPLRLVIIFVLFSAAIILLGAFYYNFQRKRIFKEEVDNLGVIASMKIRQIESWRRERIGDAAVIGHDKPLIKSFSNLLTSNSMEAEADIYAWMKSVSNAYDYKNILIADTSFKVRLSVLASDTVLGDSIMKELKSKLKSHAPFLTDFLMSKEIPYIHLDIFIPLFDSVNKKHKPIGVAILRIDPNKILFPLIQSWPTQSKSSETLLLRKEGDSVLYLNELRHAKNTALKLKLPLTNKNLLATKAVFGLEGFAEGIDYRNIPVIGSIFKIPETSWYMVAKVDKEEILMPLKKYFLMITMVVVLLILINASIFGFWIWQQRIKFYRSQLKNESSLHELEERFTTAFRMSPVSVTISSVSDNKFIDVNNTFLNDMEYTREEVIGRTARELDIWADENERLWIINEIGEKGKVSGKVNSFKTRTGKVLYGLSSMSVVKVNGESCNLSTVVNITENRKAEEKLKESEELYRELFENMLNGFAYCKMICEEGHPTDFLYLNVNESFSALTGLKDVVGKKVSEAIPGIQNSDPELLERYSRVAMTGKPEVFETWVEALKMWFAISLYSPQKGYFVAVFDVITARKFAEEKLQETNEYLSNLFNYANAPIIVWDSSLLVTRFNHAFENLSGYGADEVIGKKIDILFPKEEIKSSLSLINEAVSGERWETVEIEILRKDGYSRMVLWNSANIHDKDGKTVIATIAQGHDITKRKQAEISLKESEILLQRIIDNSNSLIYILDAEGKFIHVNQPLLTLFSTTRSKLIGQTREAFLPKEISDLHRKNDLEVIRTGKTQVFEEENIEPDGKHFYLTTKFPLTDNQNNIYAVGGLSTDITNRKTAEEELRESEIKFRQTFDLSPIGIVMVGLDRKFLRCNAAFSHTLGYKMEELVGRTIDEVTYAADREIGMSEMMKIVKGEIEYSHVQKRYLSLDGQIIWGDVMISLIRNKLGDPLYFLAIIQNITESKKVIEALRESEDKFKYVFDHSVIGKSITLPTGEISVNQAFCDIIGYSSEELTRTRWHDISHPDDLEITEKVVQSLLSGEKDSARFTKRYLHKNGSIVWCDVSTNLRRDKDGKPLYFMTALIDVTEQKRAEEMINKLNEELEQKVIHRTELLEAANQELEAFSYSVSHDLRAPLRSVHGYTKILLEEYENKLDEEGKRICGIISSSATQMGELIDDLLSFSRIGRTSINPSQLDMKSIVKSVFEEICPVIQKSKTNLKIGKLHKAFGDTNLVKLVWTNLISNAIKYSSKKNISEISIWSELKYNRVTYSVKDNGVGFDMNYKHKLFGVFQRLHSESEFEGNGVGLAIVQRIVFKHGGKVWAEGEEGKGATFYFSLPVQDVNKKTHDTRHTAHG